VVVEIEVAVEDLIEAELAAVTTVIVVVMAEVNITDINQPRCNTKDALNLRASFFCLLFLKCIYILNHYLKSYSICF
jgi:hypothetical protein